MKNASVRDALTAYRNNPLSQKKTALTVGVPSGESGFHKSRLVRVPRVLCPGFYATIG
jgi:hypothetical protein